MEGKDEDNCEPETTPVLKVNNAEGTVGNSIDGLAPPTACYSSPKYTVLAQYYWEAKSHIADCQTSTWSDPWQLLPNLAPTSTPVSAVPSRLC